MSMGNVQVQSNTLTSRHATSARLDHFITAAAELGVKIVANEPLSRHTTFRIGGPADLYATVNDGEHLIQLAELAAAHGVPTTLLGGGSNVLVSDAGIRGLVIANQTSDIREVVSGPLPAGNPPQVVADSGVKLAHLARWTIRAGWSGLEWAVSVPGSVGGAVIGNAGAHGGDIASKLAWVLVTRPGRGRQVLRKADLAFGYRSSNLKHPPVAGKVPVIVLAAGFRLKRGNVAEMTAQANAFLAKRRASQPVEPSAGSIFRNPTGDYAGRLVDEVGLKGYRIGGAQISPHHANFIVNTGNAQASDVVSLMGLMRTRVYERFGIELVPEIKFIGDWAQQPLSASSYET